MVTEIYEALESRACLWTTDVMWWTGTFRIGDPKIAFCLLTSLASICYFVQLFMTI